MDTPLVELHFHVKLLELIFGLLLPHVNFIDFALEAVLVDVDPVKVVDLRLEGSLLISYGFQ